MNSSELNSLLGGGTGGSSGGASASSLFALPSGMATLFTIFMVITSIASLAVLVFYIMNALVTYKAHRAAIETRDILREMNERDKARSSKPNPQPDPVEQVTQAADTSASTTS